MNARARGFTLMEMVVAITISSIIVIFAALLIAAPVDAYETHNRRAMMISQTSTAWPRMQADLRAALPNSVRVRRNGRYMAMEFLNAVGFARYTTPHGNSFEIAATTRAAFGDFAIGYRHLDVHLSVNNAGQEAYSQTTSMTPRLDWVQTTPLGATGNATVQVTPAFPAINWNSPRSRVYVVDGAITYLCDERLGTVTRYFGYPLAASQAARDTPAEFAGATEAEVVARGVSACNFAVVALTGQPQTVSVRLTTTRSNESVTLLHSAMLENLP